MINPCRAYKTKKIFLFLL